MKLLDINNLEFINLSSLPYDDRFFSNVKNENFGFIKPEYGGLWACVYTNLEESEWYEYCNTNDFPKYYKYYNIFTLKNNSRILYISSLLDLNIVMEDYFNFKSIRRLFNITLERAKSKDFRLKYYRRYSLDYEALSKEYDGMYIEYNPNYMGLNLFRDEKLIPYSLYGFDVSSLILFNTNCIENIRTIKNSDRELSKDELELISSSLNLSVDYIKNIIKEKLK